MVGNIFALTIDVLSLLAGHVVRRTRRARTEARWRHGRVALLPRDRRHAASRVHLLTHPWVKRVAPPHVLVAGGELRNLARVVRLQSFHSCAFLREQCFQPPVLVRVVEATRLQPRVAFFHREGIGPTRPVASPERPLERTRGGQVVSRPGVPIHVLGLLRGNVARVPNNIVFVMHILGLLRGNVPRAPNIVMYIELQVFVLCLWLQYYLSTTVNKFNQFNIF